MKTILFSQDCVRQLDVNDFEGMQRRDSRDCEIVFVYGDNDDSIEGRLIWCQVASEIIGPDFASLHLSQYPELEEIWIQNHDLDIQHYPIVIRYKNGIATDIYNGALEYDTLVDWVMTHGCI